MAGHRESSRPRRRATFPVLALVVVAVNLPQSFVVPVLPRIQADYGTDQVTAVWLITGFLLASAVATPLLGRLGDSYGQRRILLLALLLLAAGSAGAAVAPTIGWVIAMRFVQGVSGGAVPVAFATLRAQALPERLNQGVAILATVSSIAFSFGIVVPGPLMSTFGRSAIFVFPGVVAVVAAASVLLLPADGPPARGARFGVLPVTTFSGALVCVLLAISQSTRRGWTSPVVLGLCGASALLALAWVDRERRAQVPFIDLVMLRRRGVWTANLVALVAGVGLFGCAAGLPQLLQVPKGSGYGVGATLDQVGLLMAPIALSAFVISLFLGRLSRLITTRSLLVAGAALSCLSFLGMASVHDSAWAIVGWCVLQGAGNGLVLAGVATVVVAAVPASQTGVANGMNTNVRTVGGSLGGAVVAAILTTQTHAGVVAEGGFVAVFVVLAGAMAVAGGAALLVPRSQASEASDTSDLEALVPDGGLTGPAVLGRG